MFVETCCTCEHKHRKPCFETPKENVCPKYKPNRPKEATPVMTFVDLQKSFPVANNLEAVTKTESKPKRGNRK